MTDIFFKVTEVLPSGQDEVRREEVNEEEEGGIEYWSEEEWGEEWEQWEFVTEDDEEDQEYEEDEEDEGDEDDDDDEEEEKEEQDQEEDMGEGGGRGGGGRGAGPGGGHGRRRCQCCYGSVRGLRFAVSLSLTRVTRAWFKSMAVIVFVYPLFDKVDHKGCDSECFVQGIASGDIDDIQ